MNGKLDLNKFKKIGSSKSHTIFEHPEGHVIHISHEAIKPAVKKDLKGLPKHMADGGDVEESQPDQQDSGFQEGTFPMSQPDIESMQQANPEGNALEQVQAEQQTNPSQVPEQQYAKLPGFSEAAQGVMKNQASESALAHQNVQILKEAAAKDALASEAFQKGMQEKMNTIQDVVKDIQDSHIDPTHYVDSLGGQKKIGMAIGMVLSGIGSGLAHQENMASKFFNDQINRDLEAQKTNLGTKQNLLSALEKQYGDSMVAENMFRAIRAGDLANKLQQAAAASGDQQAQGRALLEISKLKQQYAPMVLKANALDAINKGQAPSDPSVLVPALVPKERQKEVFDEIKQAQMARMSRDKLLSTFDQAAKENTVLRTGAGFIRTPPSILSLRVESMPVLKDAAGRVNEMEQHVLQAAEPKPGDFDHAIAVKRKAYEALLDKKMFAPTAKSYHLDLSKFESTSMPKQAVEQQAPEIKTMGGVEYQKVPGGWQRVSK